jgi:hypothetical protein
VLEVQCLRSFFGTALDEQVSPSVSRNLNVTRNDLFSLIETTTTHDRFRRTPTFKHRCQLHQHGCSTNSCGWYLIFATSSPTVLQWYGRYKCCPSKYSGEIAIIKTDFRTPISVKFVQHGIQTSCGSACVFQTKLRSPKMQHVFPECQKYIGIGHSFAFFLWIFLNTKWKQG